MAQQYGQIGDSKGQSKVATKSEDKKLDDDGYKGLLEALWGKQSDDTPDTQKLNASTKLEVSDGDNVRKSTLAAIQIDHSELKSLTVLATGISSKIYKGVWRDQTIVFKHFNQRELSSKYEALAKKLAPSLMRPHGNILKIYGICLNPEHPIGIVSEWMELGDLKKLLSNSKEELTYASLLQICLDVARAIKHIHHDGLTVKNLSAKKILVTEKKGRWNCQLNHSNIFQIFKKTDTPLDPFWQAPEVLLDPKTAVYEKGDIWLLGCTFLEIINQGADPFMGPDNEEIVKQIYANTMHVIVPETAPARLVELIHACLAQNPEDRPSAALVLKELTEVEEELNSNPFFS